LLELVAVGPESSQRWRHTVPEGQVVRLGRSPRTGWAVPWDLRISREHCDIVLREGRLRVKCLDTALNPTYRNGLVTKEFSLGAGEDFRIGGTVFRLEHTPETDIDVPGSHPASPMAEYSYKQEDVEAFDFRNADHRLEVLWNLPRIISVSPTDDEFAQHLVGLLLDGVPRAEAAAVVQFDMDAPPERTKPIMMRIDARSDDSVRFRPSRRLIRSALERTETLLHIWNESEGGDSKYTVSGDFDWAFCVPITEKSCRGWALYVSGKLTPESSRVEDLNGDIRFTQFIAKVTGAIREVRTLERQQAGLGQFFSPKVMKTLSDQHAEQLLRPRECDTTVLFCDLRGFSRKAEQSKHDLAELLKRCSEALGLMTNGILEHDGVIADFQGDAALGFWGWPVPEGPLPALRAALAIQAGFRHAQHEKGHPLHDFNVGIGIGHGRAIAGKIGTEAQSKVGVFGPVVNLASRLESMTKQLRVPILIDAETAEFARVHLPINEGRVRKLGRVRPYGMETSLMVSQLLPPVEDDGAISDEHLRNYEAAVDSVTEGRWNEALELLDKIPVTDRAKDFLMIYIAQHNYETPETWDGVIPMSSK
jgi:adenylate cyclase